MSQSDLDIDQELNRAFDDVEDDDDEDEEMEAGSKKKKSGRGRSKVAQNERLPHPQAMFRNKINTAMRNMSHITHQTGCNAIIILNDGDRVDVYVSPHWRGSYRDHPEAYGTMIRMAKEYEDRPMVASPQDHRSYSSQVRYTPVEIKGNVREGGGSKTLVKRTMDTFITQQLSSVPLSAIRGAEDEDDEDEADPMGGIRKKLMTKLRDEDEEKRQEEKDLEKARELCSAFENANIVSTGPKKAPKPSFLI